MKYALKRTDHLAALRIVVVYTLFSAAWIYLSDLALLAWLADPAVIVRFSVIKGLIFILVTGALLYQLIARYIWSAKQIEEALRESEKRYQTLVETSPDAIFVHNGKDFLYANTAALHLYGAKTFEELRAHDIMDLIADTEREQWFKLFHLAKSGNRLPLCEGRMLRLDGKEVIIEAAGGPVNYQGGWAIQSAFHDITERKRAELALRERTTELEKRTRQLETANKELESFSYSVSHDLREPLRAIDGFSRMLARDLSGKLDEAAKHKLDIIREKTRKMDQLIEDVLTFSRLGRRAMAVDVIDLEKLVVEVWNEIRENHPQSNITINVPHLAACSGDRNMIRQVLINLLTNAVKFTEEKATATIEVGGYEEGNESVYYVKDNGIGFDMRFADKLFRLFQRLHSEEDYKGTGVGLSIVKRIIERHGGRVWAEGKVNEGATFYFALPRKN